MLKSRANITFLSVISLYVLFVLLTEGKWFLSGQMYAEMATNYFPVALDTNWIHKFFATDAGYIPFPQRLIAAFIAIFSLSAKNIPFAYNFFALILTGALVAPFCLPRFRSFVKSDATRFFTCLFLLLVADFETRTFINFTYFAIPFLFYVALMAFDRTESHLPWWVWCSPVLSLSKPAVMTVLPILMLSAVFNFRKCWKLVFACLLVVIIQMIRLKLSAQNSGAVEFLGNFTVWEKLYATINYFFGSLGAFTLGPIFSNFIIHKAKIYILWGSFFFALSFVMFFFVDRQKKFFLIAALSLIFLNVFLNCFALPLEWNQDLARLSTMPPPGNYRHVIGIFFGVVFFVLVLLQVLGLFLSKIISKVSAKHFCVILFLAWAIGNGWVKAGNNFSHLWPFPMVGSSNWHDLAGEIDSPDKPVGIFVDPYPWIYLRNCHIIGTMPAWLSTQTWTPLTLDHPLIFQKNSVPVVKENPMLISLAIVARPLSKHSISSINVRAEIVTNTDQVLSYSGQKNLDQSGGVIQLLPNSKEKLLFDDIAEIKLYTSAPIEIFSNPKGNTKGMPVIFLGN